jgi:hypothetical protein
MPLADWFFMEIIKHLSTETGKVAAAANKDHALASTVPGIHESLLPCHPVNCSINAQFASTHKTTGTRDGSINTPN